MGSLSQPHNPGGLPSEWLPSVLHVCLCEACFLTGVHTGTCTHALSPLSYRACWALEPFLFGPCPSLSLGSSQSLALPLSGFVTLSTLLNLAQPLPATEMIAISKYLKTSHCLWGTVLGSGGDNRECDLVPTFMQLTS